MDRDFMLFGLPATSTRALRCVDDVGDEEARQSLHRLSPIIWQLGYHIGKMTTLRALLGKPRLFG